ncbi:hypothetical protein GCM10025857_02220 [Alicyclobacillus contaminans]|uniref:hypothetical protein n=1 Tax=Alicyclobacillus contaminans TaxID=392016 RepID=UPI00040C266B|nr:hypothetical protein [Alicyclobacillus contaminans]GMA48865.1 hypothetical protein GCM10025857_02220 [Alicyclobacillus contaminans]
MRRTSSMRWIDGNEADEYGSIEESVVDGVDRMRDEGGIAPEVPRRPERVDIDKGTTNPENL